MTQAGLPSAERIRQRPEFERVYNDGTRLSGRFMTVFVLANSASGPRLGVAATRKIGNAVERNRAKRLARELFRRHKTAEAYDIVIVPRREMLDAPFAKLEADYQRLLERRGEPRAAAAARPRGRGGPGGRGRV